MALSFTVCWLALALLVPLAGEARLVEAPVHAPSPAPEAGLLQAGDAAGDAAAEVPVVPLPGIDARPGIDTRPGIDARPGIGARPGGDRGPAVGEPPRVRVGVYATPPFFYRDERGRAAGYVADLLATIERQGAVRIEARFYPSVEAVLEALRAGRIDAAAPLAPTPERERFLRFTAPFAELSVAILGGPRTPHERADVDTLAGQRVGVVGAGFVQWHLARLQPAARLESSADDAELLARLAFGQIDYAAVELSRAAYLIRRLGLANLKVMGTLPIAYRPSIGVDARRPEMLATLAGGLARVSGRQWHALDGAWLSPLETPWYRRPWGLAMIVTLVAGTALCVRLGLRLRDARESHLETQVGFEHATRVSSVGVWEYDVARRRLHWSAQVYALHGLSSVGFALTPEAALAFYSDEGRERLRCLLWRCMRHGEPWSVELQFRAQGGELRWAQVTGEASLRHGRLQRVYGAFHDVTERKRTEQRLHELAHVDGLTGLPNRAALLERLEARLGKPEAAACAVLFIDVDDFKAINDTRGHPAGDVLLARMAVRLVQAAGAHGFVARPGGDEFVVLVDARDAEACALRVLRAMAEPVALADGTALFVSCSIGVAHHPEHGADPAALLTAADIAMYRAKRDGKNGWRPFHPRDAQDTARRAQAVQQLRAAFDRGEFELFYQPKVCLREHCLRGFEALLRHRTPEGVRGPGAMIEAAEDSGFIATLGAWVLRTAARQSRRWRAEGLTEPIAVNVSARQLADPGFLPLMRSLVDEDAQLPRHLELELTESALVHDARQGSLVFPQLQAMGFRLHIDDFGTGYSSLAYLSRLPVHTLKIDRSFVAGLPERPEALAIVNAVLALARGLGVHVVAEGVETRAQAQALAAAGCDAAQGWLFAAALPADEALRFAREFDARALRGQAA